MPIDHFRLLGVSPSAQAETVLRAFQRRLDRVPDQGFTDEVLQQRAELLRLSADLLTDELLRQEYEAALLAGASGLELSSNREVAGLILLWEADLSIEAFNLSRKALQPPQPPALGSSREADLTLIAALSCQAASRQEEQQRHYQSAAVLLQEGIQLLQRMGKLSDKRVELEKDLEGLLPYRILDLLSRDLGDQELHQDGIQLLDNFVTERGGIEGKTLSETEDRLGQSDFVLFFQQIRKFLTVQEQLDLFVKWKKRGSSEAGFLVVIAFVAAGFSQRKPERLQQARKYLTSLDFPGLDKAPLLGCIDLLLADVKQAENRFRDSSDEDLKNWLENYPGETLASLCDYCRDWLRRDVLPGYRDIDPEPVDLEAWFADRDVQSFVESLERKSNFSFFSAFSGERQDSVSSEEPIDPTADLQIENETTNEVKDYQEFFEDQSIDSKQGSPLRSFDLSSGLKQISLKNSLTKTLLGNQIKFFGAAFLVLFVGLCATRGLWGIRINPLQETKANEEKSEENGFASNIEPSLIKPLIAKEPTKDEVGELLETWLAGKASILSGSEASDLLIVARESLVKRVQLERKNDIRKKEFQNIKATINSLKVVSKTTKRIEVKVVLNYSDQRLNSSGEIISETSIPALKVTYVLGREKNLWQLVDYISGA